MTLSEALQYAVATNPRIEAAEANYRATEQVYKQSLGRLFPEIDLRAEYGPQKIDRPLGLGPEVNNVWRNSKNVTAAFRQVLFDGFDRANDIYRSQARMTSASQKILARSDAVALNAVEAYIDVRRHLDLLDLANKNVVRHQKLAEKVRTNYDGGNAPVGDVEQTEERIEASKALVAQIKVSLETAKAKFRNAVGEEPVGLQQVPYAKGFPNSAQAVVEYAATHSPRILASLSDIEVSDYDKRQFESSLYPQLSIEGSATRGDDMEGTPGRNDELRGMVVLSWKLFDGGVRRSRTRELSERAYEKRANHDELLRQTKQEIEIAFARFHEGKAQVDSMRRQVEQNMKLIDTYENEYNAGRRSLLDLLDAENTRFRSQYELSNADSMRRYSSYELLTHMGILLDTMGVARNSAADAGSNPSFALGSGGIAPLRAPPSLRDIRSFEVPPLGSQ